jgi:hypothetical protein
MKAFGHILFLFLFLITHACFGQTNAPSQPKTVHSLTNVSDSAWRSMSAARARKPFAVLTLTNNVSQDEVLAVTDRINVDHGIDGYVDDYCGFGARLGRDYLGRGYLVSVSFEWDQRPKRTVISLRGTDAGITAAWSQDMAKALREEFGETFDDGQKK